MEPTLCSHSNHRGCARVNSLPALTRSSSRHISLTLSLFLSESKVYVGVGGRGVGGGVGGPFYQGKNSVCIFSFTSIWSEDHRMMGWILRCPEVGLLGSLPVLTVLSMNFEWTHFYFFWFLHLHKWNRTPWNIKRCENWELNADRVLFYKARLGC